jgi:Rieske Fe-S protein
MSVNLDVSRRSVLVAGVAGAGAAALAACNSGNTGSSAAGTRAAKPGTEVLALDKVPVGSSAAATADGNPVCVFRTGPNSAVCHSRICTHQGCEVNPDGAKLVCPCHGSQYDAKTGKVLQGPAVEPLAPVPVKVSGNKIVTA